MTSIFQTRNVEQFSDEFHKQTSNIYIMKSVTSSDQKYHVFAFSNGTIKIINEKLAILYSFSTNQTRIESLDFFSKNDKTFLVTFGSDVRIWSWESIEKGSPKVICTLPTQNINAISTKYDLFLTIGDEGKLESWDLENTKSTVLCQLNIPCLSLNQTRSQIFVGSESGCKIFDIQASKVVNTVYFDGKTTGKGAIKSISIDGEEKWMVIGGESYFSSLFHVPTMTLTSILPTSAETNDTMIKDHVVTVGNESGVYFWDFDGKFVKRMDTGLRQVLGVSSFGSYTVVCGMGSKCIFLSKHLVNQVDLK